MHGQQSSSSLKEWINNASYKELLRNWRFGEIGDPIFQGDVGIHYAKVMRKKKEETDPATQVAISKEIGW